MVYSHDRIISAMINQTLVHAILKDIDSKSKDGIAPITSDMLAHLSSASEVLDHLITMKAGRVISGDLISEALTHTPRRMTSIRLTLAGMRMLRDGPEKAALPHP